MALSTFFVVSLLFSSVVAHTFLTNIVVNGVTQKNCLRSHPSSNFDYPVSSVDNKGGLQSAKMICGLSPATAAPSKCIVPAGSTVGFQWHYAEAGPDVYANDVFIIDPSHKGPCMVYMARTDVVTPTGPVWFKVYEDGYDGKQFCVDKLIKNKGLFEMKVPTGLAPGNYVVRAEIIALHEGDQIGGAQPYIHCVEFTITGSGSVVPSGNGLVSFPGAYQATEAGINFDIYRKFSSYPIPGPAVYSFGSSNTGATQPASTSTSTSTSTTGRTSSTSTTTGRVTTPSSTSSTTGKVTTPSSTSSTTGRVTTPSSTSTTTGRVTTPSSTSTSTTGSTSGSSSNCVGATKVLSSKATVSIDAWNNIYRLAITVENKNPSADWYVELTYPESSTTIQTVLNGASLSCQAGSRAILKPLSWASSASTVEIEIHALNLLGFSVDKLRSVVSARVVAK